MNIISKINKMIILIKIHKIIRLFKNNKKILINKSYITKYLILIQIKYHKEKI